MKKEIIIAIIAMVLSSFNTVPKNRTQVDTVNYNNYVYVSNEYPHNTQSFTQGLFYYNGEMYETTGLYGQSKLYKNTNIKTGESENSFSFDNSIFAEGSVVFNDELYVLTYKENKVYVFDPETLEQKREIPYNRQGWGLTTDGKFLIASDGSCELFFMNEKLETLHTITVKRNGNNVRNINELEYINGYIWANEWLTNNILIINPKNGNVIKQIDFSGIYSKQITDSNDVLNGIAYNETTNKIYITGKRWDTLYELEIKK